MELLKPELLKQLIQHSKPVTMAFAMINHHWSDVLAKYGSQVRIDARIVMLAKQLTQSGLAGRSVDFNNYAEVKRYLIQNDVYMSPSGRRELLKPFQE